MLAALSSVARATASPCAALETQWHRRLRSAVRSILGQALTDSATVPNRDNGGPRARGSSLTLAAPGPLRLLSTVRKASAALGGPCASAPSSLMAGSHRCWRSREADRSVRTARTLGPTDGNLAARCPTLPGLAIGVARGIARPLAAHRPRGGAHRWRARRGALRDGTRLQPTPEPAATPSPGVALPALPAAPRARPHPPEPLHPGMVPLPSRRLPGRAARCPLLRRRPQLRRLRSAARLGDRRRDRGSDAARRAADAPARPARPHASPEARVAGVHAARDREAPCPRGGADGRVLDDAREARRVRPDPRLRSPLPGDDHRRAPGYPDRRLRDLQTLVGSSRRLSRPARIAGAESAPEDGR